MAPAAPTSELAVAACREKAEMERLEALKRRLAVAVDAYNVAMMNRNAEHLRLQCIELEETIDGIDKETETLIAEAAALAKRRPTVQPTALSQLKTLVAKSAAAESAAPSAPSTPSPPPLPRKVCEVDKVQDWSEARATRVAACTKRSSGMPSCRVGCGEHLCVPCQQIHNSLWKAYKGKSVVHELVARLKFDYVFGIINDEHLEKSTWLSDLSVPDRDTGHLQRYRCLAGNAKNKGVLDEAPDGIDIRAAMANAGMKLTM